MPLQVLDVSGLVGKSLFLSLENFWPYFDEVSSFFSFWLSNRSKNLDPKGLFWLKITVGKLKIFKKSPKVLFVSGAGYTETLTMSLEINFMHPIGTLSFLFSVSQCDAWICFKWHLHKFWCNRPLRIHVQWSKYIFQVNYLKLQELKNTKEDWPVEWGWSRSFETRRLISQRFSIKRKEAAKLFDKKSFSFVTWKRLRLLIDPFLFFSSNKKIWVTCKFNRTPGPCPECLINWLSFVLMVVTFSKYWKKYFSLPLSSNANL